MNILIVSTSEMTGGAAIAARRLMVALNKYGEANKGSVKAKMLVRDKSSDCPDVIALKTSKFGKKFRFAFERGVIWACNRFSKKNLFQVSIANTGYDITKTKEFKEADVIHLHWTQQGMLSLRDMEKIFKSGKKVVWTMHDMWACTGICHHAYRCNKYMKSCGQCMFLSDPSNNDLSHLIFCKKQKLYAKYPFSFVAVSSWLKDIIRVSTLAEGHDVCVIPNVISTSDYVIKDKQKSRDDNNIPSDAKVLVFGAARVDDPIKDFNTLIESLSLITSSGKYNNKDLHLIIFGALRDRSLLNRIPIGYTYLGKISSTEFLSKIYSASDIVVSSSFYETFGQTLVEGMLCGCIPVAFGNSGTKDIISHLGNGYLVPQHSAEDLANGILWALDTAIDRDGQREQAVNHFSESIVAEQYCRLFASMH